MYKIMMYLTSPHAVISGKFLWQKIGVPDMYKKNNKLTPRNSKMSAGKLTVEVGAGVLLRTLLHQCPLDMCSLTFSSLHILLH